MRKVPVALAASLSVLVGLAALVPAAEARGGGGFGGGGFGGHGGGGFVGRGDVGPGGRGEWGPGGSGYGTYPGRPNPWARNVYPWVGVDLGNVYAYPDAGTTNNSAPSGPYDCNYLFQKAQEADSAGSSSYWWSLFNQCSHGK